MKEIKGIDHVSIAVNNMEETLDFYQKVLGCEFVMRTQLDWVDAELALVKLNSQFIEFTYKPDTPRLKTDRWEVGHLGLVVDDINAVVNNLQNISNIKFIDKEPAVATDTLTVFFFEGPSGEVIELVQYS